MDRPVIITGAPKRSASHLAQVSIKHDLSRVDRRELVKIISLSSLFYAHRVRKICGETFTASRVASLGDVAVHRQSLLDRMDTLLENYGDEKVAVAVE